MHPLFAGSKRKAKIAAREQRQVRAIRVRLNKIRDLAALIRTEAELDLYLEQITDDAVRAETKNLLEPFLRFTLKTIVLADRPIDTGPVVQHHRVPEPTR